MKIAPKLRKGPKMSKLVKYSLSFDVFLDKNDPSDPDWIRAIIEQALGCNEYVKNFKVELVG